MDNVEALYPLPESASYRGYQDLDGQFIPFEAADEVFVRAQALGARVLLRLELDDQQALKGKFYTNDRSLCS
ncbi:MAG: hypothetical protein AAF384_04975 [Pseudomonadota bacterium]